MYHLFFTAKKMFPALVLALPFLACGQTQPRDPMSDHFEQLLRRMDEQMRRGMPFDSSFQNGRVQISPDSSSYFYFHIDTSFNGLGGSDFFRSAPFGGLNPGGFPDMDSLFEQFFGRMDRLNPRRGYDDFPADDGEKAPGEDEMLPEERLRLQEQQGEQGAKPAPPAGEPAPTAKPKVKTIRI